MYISLDRATAGGWLSMEQFAEVAASAGFPAADVDLAYAADHGVNAFRDLFASRHLKYGGWGVPFDWRGEESKRQEGLERLTRFAKVASELKIDSCATWIMPSSERPFLKNWEDHVSRLKPVAARLGDAGLRLGLEFIGPYHLRRKFHHEFVFSPGLMLELADAVGPNVGLLVDSFHVHTSGMSLEHLSQIPAARIVLVHLNDCPKVPVWAAEDGKRVLPGEGVIDVKGFVGALAKAGYNGPVSLEVFSDELKAMSPPEAAKKAGAATRKVLPELFR